MKRVKLLALSAVAVLAVCTSSSVAQNAQKDKSFVSDMYLISAKAGGVNYTQGTVSVSRPEGRGGLLIRGDKLDAAERVETGTDSRAEILLNPGSFMRLGDNSAFEFVDTSLDDLRIKLVSGTAIFEVITTNDFKVSVFTPQNRVTIVNSGVYRIDLARDGSGTLSVIEGQAVVGQKSVTVVKEGYTGTLGIGTATTAKFDRGRRDDLAEWSRSRSKELTKVASKLKNSNVNLSLTSSFNRGVWGLGQTFGLWVFDPRFGACFLPFYSGWRNPYGYGYNAYIYYPPSYYNIPVDQKRTRLDGRLEPPVDMETKSGRRAPSTYSAPSDNNTKDPGMRLGREPSYSPPISREPVYSPPAPVTKGDKP